MILCRTSSTTEMSPSAAAHHLSSNSLSLARSWKHNCQERSQPAHASSQLQLHTPQGSSTEGCQPSPDPALARATVAWPEPQASRGTPALWQAAACYQNNRRLHGQIMTGFLASQPTLAWCMLALSIWTLHDTLFFVGPHACQFNGAGRCRPMVTASCQCLG